MKQTSKLTLFGLMCFFISGVIVCRYVYDFPTLVENRIVEKNEKLKQYDFNNHHIVQSDKVDPTGSGKMNAFEDESKKRRMTLSDEITVVTAYWNLGRFRKGEGDQFYDNALYKKWTNVFRYLHNPVVVYTDSEEFAILMRNTRNETNHRTKIFQVERNTSWAFLIVDKIKLIYSMPGYPKHHPNTVIPEYSCAQHAKYDVTAKAAKNNFYNTKYLAWVDIGYFRDRQSKHPFRLVIPEGFNEYTIAMSEVYRKNNKLTHSAIFVQNQVWVCGCLFLGTRDMIIQHEKEYRKAVYYFLSNQLMNTDQQVLYGMYSDEGIQKVKPKTHIQAYWANGGWFYLGHIMIRHLNASTI